MFILYTNSIRMIGTILTLTVLCVILLFILNFVGVGVIVPPIILGPGSFYLSKVIVESYINNIENSITIILSGLCVLFIMGAYATSQDDSRGPSEIRSQIQGIGIYTFIASVILAYV